jgi:hypothetical protein
MAEAAAAAAAAAAAEAAARAEEERRAAEEEAKRKQVGGKKHSRLRWFALPCSSARSSRKHTSCESEDTTSAWRQGASRDTRIQLQRTLAHLPCASNLPLAEVVCSSHAVCCVWCAGLAVPGLRLLPLPSALLLAAGRRKLPRPPS